MHCIHNGKACVMIWDVNKGKFVYIPEKRWDKMAKEQKREYKHAPFCKHALADSELLHPIFEMEGNNHGNSIHPAIHRQSH